MDANETQISSQQPNQPIDAAAIVAQVEQLQAESAALKSANTELKATLVKLSALLHIEGK